ncbi:innexin inx7-like isoform X3 [Agrilus planipennis]|uniref:Innexin n=1 Tax=Agrilus planipennis TaxID=224129 RepID=A0A1W4XBR3_AGRPL|nr:innexin inx7-like isoform X3 [Agrilus planipennis]XP_018333549.1 innexin inx7-like isoform X3 [Agrilus planipennis]XP_018333550.1 innexin inx7-like isoform X3 [Agrilus planipennis]XP_018333551.1 innexin inx7-like isoform X3 [Agrilus planipennis]
MIHTFATIKANFKLFPQSIYIDNYVFKLHYRITTLLLLVATILVTSRQYIGEHIRCISDNGVPPHVINTFCFFTATYTVVKYLNSSLVDLEAIAHPGVGAFGPLGYNSPEPIIRHSYYQWVPFVLFIQAIMFHLPHLIWKHYEGGQMHFPQVRSLRINSVPRCHVHYGFKYNKRQDLHVPLVLVFILADRVHFGNGLAFSHVLSTCTQSSVQ